MTTHDSSRSGYGEEGPGYEEEGPGYGEEAGGSGEGEGPDPEELKGGRMKEVVDMGVWGGVTYISDIARRGWATL